MADHEDPDWTPEKEREEDPGKLQREPLEMGREILKRMKENKAKEEVREKMIEQTCEGPVAASQPGHYAPVYQPPLLSEVLDRYEAAWKAICARFEDPGILMAVFQILLHQPFRLTENEQGP